MKGYVLWVVVLTECGRYVGEGLEWSEVSRRSIW
jgi:hypothetical protein